VDDKLDNNLASQTTAAGSVLSVSLQAQVKLGQRLICDRNIFKYCRDMRKMYGTSHAGSTVYHHDIIHDVTTLE